MRARNPSGKGTLEHFLGGFCEGAWTAQDTPIFPGFFTCLRCCSRPFTPSSHQVIRRSLEGEYQYTHSIDEDIQIQRG